MPACGTGLTKLSRVDCPEFTPAVAEFLLWFLMMHGRNLSDEQWEELDAR